MNNSYFSRSDVLKHALATPLTTILLNTEMAMDSKGKSNYSYHLDKIMLSAQYLSSILGLSENSDTPTSFNLYSAINELITIGFHGQDNSQVITHLNHVKDITIQGNKLLFQESIICLLNNSLESYETTHKIVYITALLDNKNNKLTLSITDGGKGMTLGEQTLTMTAGYSGKENHTGIGLDFAKEVITKQCGGSLTIDSKKDRGTTVSMILNIVGKKLVNINKNSLNNIPEVKKQKILNYNSNTITSKESSDKSSVYLSNLGINYSISKTTHGTQ